MIEVVFFSIVIKIWVELKLRNFLSWIYDNGMIKKVLISLYYLLCLVLDRMKELIIMLGEEIFLCIRLFEGIICWMKIKFV